MNFQDKVLELINSRRTIRKFSQELLDEKVLIDCINTARLAPSAANLQPIEYLLINEKKKIDRIFPLLKWAAYITPNGNPAEDERPTAYLIVLINKEMNKIEDKYDVGAAVENFIISALAKGIGTCWMLSIDRMKIRQIFNIPEKYYIDCVIAAGYPKEIPQVEETSDNIKYWKDDSGILHVPKRKLKNVLHINKLDRE